MGFNERPAGPVVVIGDIMADIAIRPVGDVRPASDTESEIRLGVGGTGANTSIHLARLGADVLLLGRVGDDDLGRFVAQRLQREGVRLPGAPWADTATGAIGILVDAQGQRTMFPQQGANGLVNEEFIQKHWPAQGGTADGTAGHIAALFVSGYALFREASREAALWAMARAQGAGVPVFVDPASYALIEDVGVDEFLRWTAGATVLLPNREEAAVLARLGEVGTASGGEGASAVAGGGMTLTQARDAAERLAQRFPVVVVTLDRDGALARAGDAEWHVPGHRVAVVDTTGAGDAFNAAFLMQCVADAEIPAAVEAGHRLAAAVVQRMGPT